MRGCKVGLCVHHAWRLIHRRANFDVADRAMYVLVREQIWGGRLLQDAVPQKKGCAS